MPYKWVTNVGRWIVAEDTDSNEWQLLSGLQKAKIQRILYSCRYLYQYLSIFVLLHKSSSGYYLYVLSASLFNKSPQFIAHKCNARNSNVLFIHMYIFYFIILWSLIKLICVSGSTKRMPPQWPSPCHKSKPKSASITENYSLSRKPNHNHDLPTQFSLDYFTIDNRTC